MKATENPTARAAAIRLTVVAAAWLLAVCALLDGCGESTTSQPSTAAVALTDLATLAEPRAFGTATLQVSSYDRTGHNADFGISPADAQALFGTPFSLDNSYLYRQDERYVVFDDLGPGVVDRIWMTSIASMATGHLDGDIAFEIDDEPAPRLVSSLDDLFSGNVPPFLAPLAGNSLQSSGGFYSVLPIPYARHLRISTSSVPNYLNITYTRLPISQAVDSFDPHADTRRAAAALAVTAEDPKHIEPTLRAHVDVDLAAGTQQMVWEHRGPGTVLALELTGPYPEAEIPIGLRLRARWDDAREPQVDAPVDDLFGAALGPAARSVAFGYASGRYYFYFPMPFSRSAEVTIASSDAAVHGWQVALRAVDRLLTPNALPFHAFSKMARQDIRGRDFELLDFPGHGQIVAVVLTAACADEGACRGPNDAQDGLHLEGDERISIDASRYPQLHGTGVEDFFNGGFYFSHGPFALPTHGNPASATTSSRRPGVALRSMYRLFLHDPIVFQSQIRFALEHGPDDDVPVEFSSLAMFYADAQPSMQQTDAIDFGDAQSETAHEVSAVGRADREISLSFRGEDPSPLRLRGLDADQLSFRVAIQPENRGVLLRRVANIRGGRQAAAVRVNGTQVGTWFSSDVNARRGWAELDFSIPESFTRGRNEMRVQVDATGSPHPWNIFGLTAFSYMPQDK